MSQPPKRPEPTPQDRPWEEQPDEVKVDFITKHIPSFKQEYEHLGAFLKTFDRPQQFTVEEFDRFMPIFSTELASKMAPSELMDIDQEFWSVIDPYRPIQIVELDDENRPALILTLPRMYLELAPNSPGSDPIAHARNVTNIQRSNDPVANHEGRQGYIDSIRDNCLHPDNLRRLALAKAETKHILKLLEQRKTGTASTEGTQSDESSPSAVIEDDFYEA